MQKLNLKQYISFNAKLLEEEYKSKCFGLVITCQTHIFSMVHTFITVYILVKESKKLLPTQGPRNNFISSCDIVVSSIRILLHFFMTCLELWREIPGSLRSKSQAVILTSTSSSPLLELSIDASIDLLLPACGYIALLTSTSSWFAFKDLNIFKILYRFLLHTRHNSGIFITSNTILLQMLLLQKSGPMSFALCKQNVFEGSHSIRRHGTW